MPAPQTKGLQFRSFLRALGKIRGDRAVADTLAALRPELGDALRIGTLVTGGWYPLEWYRELHVAAQKATREGVELARAVSRAGIQDDFRGVYRLITFALSPQAIIRWAPRIVSLYFDTGGCVIERAEAGFARGRFVGFAGFDRNLWEDLIGGITGVMELAGGRQLTTHVIAGGTDGHVGMTIEVRWKT